MKIQIFWGGRVGGGQGRCEQGREVFVKIKKNNFFFGGGGSGPGGVGGRRSEV